MDMVWLALLFLVQVLIYCAALVVFVTVVTGLVAVLVMLAVALFGD